MNENEELLIFLGVSAAIKLLGSIITWGSKPKNVQYVGKVSRVTLFPGKSMRGVDLDKAICTQEGLKHATHQVYDRCLLVTKDNRFISAKMAPKIVTIRPTFEGTDKVVLHGEAVKPLTVSLQRNEKREVVTAVVLRERVQGQDCGDEAAEWISSYLETPGLRLLVGAPGLPKRNLTERGDKWTRDSKPGDKVTFSNTHPFLVMSESGLKDFNEKLGEQLSMDRFRPNIVVSGCEPFDEDKWSEIWIGDLKFSNVKPCQRCPNTTVDPKTGTKHESNEPLNTLGKYRNVCADWPKTGIFGALLVLDSKEGIISRGDDIYVLRKPSDLKSLW